MAKRNIRVDDDPVLRKISRPVEKFDDRLFQLLDDMKETLDAACGIGLAAPQVGILRRVVVIDLDGKYMELINPEIIEEKGTQSENEGCLSLPHKVGKTVRPMSVKVRAQNREGKWCLYSGTELLARCFCHELDHLEGKLYTDRLAPGEKLYYTEDN